MLRVIINADDLGISPIVNKAIGKALKAGHITSSTILANSNYWDDIHNIVNENPHASFGIHLNLTEGKCLSDARIFRKYDVVDDENQFTKKIRCVKHLNQELLEAIEKEWDAQISKVVEIERIAITHLDGHHHIHADFPFKEIIVKLLQKYNISIIRNRYIYPLSKPSKLMLNIISYLPSNIVYSFTKMLSSNRYVSIIKNYTEGQLWKQRIQEYAFLTYYFDSYEHFSSLMQCYYNISDDVIVELMCHPGHENYLEEYKMIELHLLEKLIPNVELVSYKIFINK